jgi:hypothetical protein
VIIGLDIAEREKAMTVRSRVTMGGAMMLSRADDTGLAKG